MINHTIAQNWLNLDGKDDNDSMNSSQIALAKKVAPQNTESYICERKIGLAIKAKAKVGFIWKNNFN